MPSETSEREISAGERSKENMENGAKKKEN